MGQDDQWAAARRIEGWAGEVRVNLVRLAALIVLYGQHVVNVLLIRDDPTLAGSYNTAVTALAAAWSVSVVLLYFFLARRWVPPALKYVVTLWDVILISVLVALSDVSRTPLLVLYFLVIIAAPLRLSLPLVYVTTLSSIAAYLGLVGAYAYYVVGYERYYTEPGLRIPRTHEVIFVLALGAAGILAGQVVRQARRLAQGYPVVVEHPRDQP
jgi:hypothetical protein